MRKLLVPVVVLLMLVPVIAGCGSSSSPDEPVNKKARGYNLQAESSGFAFALFGQVMSEDYGENIVISPASIHAALSMLLNGARGETAGEIRRALRVEELDQATLNQAWADLITSAQAGEGSKLSIADAAVITLIPVLLLFLALGDRIIKGLALQATK